MRAISSTVLLSLFGLACCDVGTASRIISTENSSLNQCPCTDKNIWIDVFFLIDSSQAMTANGFDEATAFAQAVMYKLNIGQMNGQVTRLGFITYSANASLIYRLTDFTSSDDILDIGFNYEGNKGTNIDSAIKIAAESFKGPGHRSNVQKVIVIVASAYENGKYNDPTEVAKKFIEDGGFVITVEYVQEHGAPVPLLANLSSGPEYSFTNRYANLTAEQIRQAFCKINCFCPTNSLPFTQGGVTPTGGCYSAVPINTTWGGALGYCRFNLGVNLVKVESSAQSQFLSTLFPSKTKSWIGLRYVDAGLYQWADGTVLGPNDFQKWAPGFPTVDAGDCVYMYQYSDGLSYAWFNGVCNSDLYQFSFICQRVPCSADYYCPTRD